MGRTFNLTVDTAREIYLADVESVDFLDGGEDGAVSLINE